MCAGDSDPQAWEPRRLPTSKNSDVQKSVERMKQYMELRGLRPNTVSAFSRCARRFLTQVGKMPEEIGAGDVEWFLLDLARRGRSPLTRNVSLAAIRCLLTATLGNVSRGVTAGIPNAKPPRRCPGAFYGAFLLPPAAIASSVPCW